MAISKTQRWLDLIAFLVRRRLPVTVEDIMEGVPAYAVKWRTEDATTRASVRRMFERDKDELRAAGIPLETTDYRVEGVETQGYRLSGRDFYLPYLRIVGAQEAGAGRRAGGQETGDRGQGAPGRAPGRAGSAGLPSTAGPVELTTAEAQLAMDALRRVAELPGSPFAAEARSALAKLRFDLAPPPAERPPADAEAAPERAAAEHLRTLATAPVLYADAPAAGALRDLLRLLTDALHGRRRVTFRYHGIHRGEATDRDVAPYGVLYQHGHWYLIGHDATRDAVRVFRLGRMEDARAGDPGGYEHDPAFDLSRYARREPWELGDDQPLAALVRFDFPLSLWAERNEHGSEVERLQGGAVVRRFEVRQTEPFLRWLQGFGGEAVVTEPEELREAQAALAGETLELYGG